MARAKNDAVRKIMFQGLSESGKTQLKNRFLKGTFCEEYSPTFPPIDYSRCKVKERTDTSYEIWDFNGAPKFQMLHNGFLKNADCIIYCIDLTKSEDFNAHKPEIDFFQDLTEQCRGMVVPIIIVGTKMDLVEEDTITDFIEAFKDYEDDKHLLFLTLSAKNDDDSVFEKLRATINSLTVFKEQESIDDHWNQAINDLRTDLAKLSVSKQNKVIAVLNQMLTDAKDPSKSPEEKAQAIKDAKNSVDKIVDAVDHPVGKSFAVIAAIVLVTVLVGLVGFGIGFGMSAWTGPGAFFAGIAAGTLAANAVIGSSIGVGATASIITAVGLFKKPTSAVEKIAIADFTTKNIDPLMAKEADGDLGDASIESEVSSTHSMYAL